MEYRLWSLISRIKCYQHLDLTPINGDRIRKHRAKLSSLSDREMESIAKVVQIAADLPLYMNDNRGINVAGIASEARQVKARPKLTTCWESLSLPFFGGSIPLSDNFCPLLNIFIPEFEVLSLLLAFSRSLANLSKL
jgi:replicative DNA helicase